ncbi:MAG: putative nicotinate-nucleotide pyrophosphorylase, partial [Actinomycetota bacterium]
MLTTKIIADVVQRALDEDAPWGDATSEHLIPANATATAVLNAREDGVFAGADVFAAAFELTDPSIEVDLLVADGQRFVAGQQLAKIT